MYVPLEGDTKKLVSLAVITMHCQTSARSIMTARPVLRLRQLPDCNGVIFGLAPLIQFLHGNNASSVEKKKEPEG